MSVAVTVRIALAATILGLALGLVPAYSAEGGSFGGGVSCGSPFFGNGDNLTGTGLSECETAGGLSTRRAWAIGILGIAVLLGADALIQAQTFANTATETGLTQPWTGLPLDEDPISDDPAR